MHQLPEYVSHKTVRAARIERITLQADGCRMATLTLALPDGSTTQHPVSVDYIDKHAPTPGGYFVQYADGYVSFSPAEAFESGYSRKPDPKPLTEEERKDILFYGGDQWSTAQVAELALLRPQMPILRLNRLTFDPVNFGVVAPDSENG